MLSYRHAFHAGNHADVLKHAVLVHVLDYLLQKDKPFWYIDTHAGAGRYALEKGYAAQQGEFRDGISRLWGGAAALPSGLARYLEVIRPLNPDGALRHYPGSPWIARQLLRPGDRLWLHELHSTDLQLLQACCAGQPANTAVAASDGFDALKALLPPQPRRGVVLIDPAYELKSDYARVIAALKDALERFATGVYLVWHPLLARREAHQMAERLQALRAPWLHATLSPRDPALHENGMVGSGMFVLNPPFTLHAMLAECLPLLRQRLAQDRGAAFTLATSED